jgi:hypothetical protein
MDAMIPKQPYNSKNSVVYIHFHLPTENHPPAKAPPP